MKTKSATKAGTTVTLKIDSYSGHTYLLQKSTTTPDTANFTTNVGSPQQGKHWNNANLHRFQRYRSEGVLPDYG